MIDSRLLMCIIFATLQIASGGQLPSARAESRMGPPPDFDFPVAWGMPTNSVSLGVSVGPPQKVEKGAGTSRSGSGVALYLANFGLTNMSFDWIAPPGCVRYRSELYDPAGILCENRALFQQPTTHYRTVYEIPRDRRGVVGGLVRLPTNAVIPFASARFSHVQLANQGAYSLCLVQDWPPSDRVTNVFALHDVGTYRLVIKGEIMRISATNVFPVELPAVSVRVRWPGFDSVFCEHE